MPGFRMGSGSGRSSVSKLIEPFQYTIEELFSFYQEIWKMDYQYCLNKPVSRFQAYENNHLYFYKIQRSKLQTWKQ